MDWWPDRDHSNEGINVLPRYQLRHDKGSGSSTCFADESTSANRLAKGLCEPHISDVVERWFRNLQSNLPIPITGSVDVRDSGSRVCIVDTNRFPAGFNHLHSDERPVASQLFSRHFKRQCSSSNDSHLHVHIFPEAFTRNAGYVDSLIALKEIIEKCEDVERVTVGTYALPSSVTKATGSEKEIEFDSVRIKKGVDRRNDAVSTGIEVEAITWSQPDFVLWNDDMSTSQTHFGAPWDAVCLGWHRRSKSSHFAMLDSLLRQFYQLVGSMDRSLGLLCEQVLQPAMWGRSSKVDLSEASSIDRLCRELDEARGGAISDGKTWFVKNDSGTYGMGITCVSSGTELGAKLRTNVGLDKLSYSKNGGRATSFVFQEGISTNVEHNGKAAEPVLYLVDGEVVSMFLRVNESKGSLECLNTPSQFFVSGRDVMDRIPHFAVYSVLARLAMIAMAQEAILHAALDPAPNRKPKVYKSRAKRSISCYCSTHSIQYRAWLSSAGLPRATSSSLLRKSFCSLRTGTVAACLVLSGALDGARHNFRAQQFFHLPRTPATSSMSLSKSQAAKPKAVETTETREKRLLSEALQAVRSTNPSSGVIAAFASEVDQLRSDHLEIDILKMRLDQLVKQFKDDVEETTGYPSSMKSQPLSDAAQRAMIGQNADVLLRKLVSEHMARIGKLEKPLAPKAKGAFAKAVSIVRKDMLTIAKQKQLSEEELTVRFHEAMEDLWQKHVK
eukprot:gene566-10_t